MSKNAAGVLLVDTLAALDKLYRNQRLEVRSLLIALDPEDPKTLPFWVTHLLKAHFAQKELADHLRVSRATISRWATQDETVPRSPAVRGLYVAGLRGLLDEAIGDPKPKRPPMAKPHGVQHHQRSSRNGPG